MSKAPAPPRLTVLTAARSPRALILSRGPSNWYHLIGWDTQKDTFEHGAWFRGRIYEERCDLSPNGELLVYFALNGDWNSNYKGSWIAVSRPPWLYALTLWPQGDTWGGGGCFQADRELILPYRPQAHPDHPERGLKIIEGKCDRAKPRPEIADSYWSGYDQTGYPIYTRDGRVLRRRKDGDEIVADFNDLTPDPKRAPAWARKPLP